MNTEPSRTPEKMTDTTRQQLKRWLTRLPSRLLVFVTHNWQWKLIAIFCAMCLWAGLISQDATLTRERTFTDASINVTGAESLRRNSGLIVLSGLESENLRARMRVEVPQREYTNASASNYNPRVDLTRITEPGEQTLRVITTTSATYGSVVDLSPGTITVTVDEYVTNYRVPVSLNLTGDYPDGFYASTPSLDPSSVAISGPRTIVDQIARIVVDFDASTLSARAGTVRLALPMRFEDREGNELESNLTEVSSAGVVLRTIGVELDLYPTRTLPLSDAALITGEPAEGYQVKRVTLTPSELRAAGDQEVLDALETLVLDTPVDITGASESFTRIVRAKRNSDLAYLSAENITVTVEIEPIPITRTFENVRLAVRGAVKGPDVAVDARTITVMVTGPQLALDGLRASKINAYVDVSGLEAGTHTLPVEMYVEDASPEEWQFSAIPHTVTVTITAD